MKQKNNLLSAGLLFIKTTLVALFLSVSFTSHSQIISTVAGNTHTGYSGDGGQATAADLDMPQGVAVDASGNIYIADFSDYRIRKVNTSGIITTFAGTGAGAASGDGGQASAATIGDCADVKVDAAGNVYIVGESQHRIRKVNTSGIISTIAGSGTAGFSGDGGQATAADLDFPYGIALDASGNLYIADMENSCVRKVTVATGIITTFAGKGGNSGHSGDGGLATAAKLTNPIKVALDASGNVYIADQGAESVRIVNTSNIINIFAGTENKGGYTGDGGPATAALLNGPDGVAVDASGNVYISDIQNRRVRIVNTSGLISTVAGTGIAGYSGDGGQAIAADLNGPTGIAINSSGNIYIADNANQDIREITPSFSVLAGAADISCNGTNTGGVSAVPYDGTSPYTYSWSPGGATTSSLSGLYAGTYTITLTENGGTTASASVTVTQPAALTSSASETSPACSGLSNGSASATASNGTSPYTYSWSPVGGTKTSATGLSAGTYTVTVNDNCTASSTAAVVILSSNVIVSATQTAFTCSGSSNGVATATASNGTTPYTYSWSSGGQTTSNATGLSVGTYTVTVNDKCGLAVTASAIISQGNTLTSDNTSVVNNITCHGATNGSVTATPNGSAPFTYSWTGGNLNVIVPHITATISGLSAATYSVTVHDHCGTLLTSTITLTQPNALSVGASAPNITCYGNTTTATATPSNGTKPYTYSWSGGLGTNSTAGGLSAGSYTVTVQDSCGASVAASVTITAPGALSTGAGVINNVTCRGGSDGNALANASGGTSPYTFSWSNGNTNNPTGNVLGTGTYTVTVTDNCNATATASVTITQPLALTASASVTTNVSCHGESTGSASVSPSGGTIPYTYSWSGGGGANSSTSGLNAGKYTIMVQDNCGNTATASVTITQPAVSLTATALTVANVSCWEGSNGQAKASVSGGSTPYIYSWSPVGSSAYMASGLSVGTYTITVIDNNGCSKTSSTTLTQPALLRDSVAIVTYPQCGGETASATIGVKGGTSPYNYTWSPNISSTSSATGLSVRAYEVQVKDNNGCYNNLNFSITQPPIPVMRDSIVSSATVNELCNGGSTGSATVGVKYGTAPYTYSWSVGGTNATVDGLSVGTYSVTVNDMGGCIVTASVFIGQPAALSATAFTSGNVSCNGGSNGQAKISINGGSAPYTYSWSSTINSSYIASGLSAGTYTITVSDLCGASVTSSTVITQPSALSDSVATIGYPVCIGETGNATIGVTGGASPYTYSWSPDISSTATATGLVIRSYAVLVKDNNGCHNANLNFNISQPAALRDSIIHTSIVNISCNGSNSGSATVGVKYGTMPYTYSWSPAGGNSATAAGLSGGTYTVTVNDGGGCTVTASVSISQPGVLTPIASIGTAITCNGNSNGMAKVSVSGGSTPYTYSWSPVSSFTYIASGLSAGTYSVTVEDNCGTSASTSIAVSQPAILSDSVITSSVVSPPCSGGGTGSATIGVTGGTSPYNYKWSPNVSTTATATGLTVRSYIVQVKDAKGCYNNITLNVTCSTPETVTYKGTGASCCPLSDNINLYPNPNTGQFTLSGLQQGIVIEMYDYTGKMISRMTTINESIHLNILNQADGIYLIRILDKDGNLVSEKKVVKTQ